MLIRPFTEPDRPAVLALWSQAFDYSSPHNNPNLSPTLLRLFYSPTQRMHPDAKTKFIQPDLAPLPTIIL